MRERKEERDRERGGGERGGGETDRQTNRDRQTGVQTETERQTAIRQDIKHGHLKSFLAKERILIIFISNHGIFRSCGFF